MKRKFALVTKNNKIEKKKRVKYSIPKRLFNMRSYSKFKSEIKQLVFQITGNPIGTSAIIGSAFLPGIQQGLTVNDRIGNYIQWVDMSYDIIVYPDSATVNSWGQVDMLIDENPDGLATAFGEIYNGQLPTDLLLTSAQTRFTRIVAEPVAIDNLAHPSQRLKGYRKIQRQVHYTANNGTVSDMKGGGPNLIVTLRSGQAATLSYNISGHIRVRYYDP